MATGVKDDQNAQGMRDHKGTSCPCCSQPHPLHRCNRFKEKTHVQRNDFVKVKGLCYNCLKDTPVQQNGTTFKHIAKCCPSKFKCKVEGCAADEFTLSNQVESFWKLESLGNTSQAAKPKSIEDKRAEKIIESTIGKIDGHYQMGLLWKRCDPRFPNNRPVAEMRLRHLRRLFERDPVLKKYLAIIDDYVEKGYARKLTPEETKVRSNKTWYLPHHPVLNPRSWERCAQCSMQRQHLRVRR